MSQQSLKKWVVIGMFSSRGTTCIFYMENGKLKTFSDYRFAERYILEHGIGTNASPVEVYEEP